MRYRIEFGQSDANRMKAQKFRQRVFRESETGLDEDKFDKISHVFLKGSLYTNNHALAFIICTFSHTNVSFTNQPEILQLVSHFVLLFSLA